MSDFTSNFWSVFITAITLGGIVGCLLLLWFSGQTKAMTLNDNTTGHVWDEDLREMNNPLPRWWVGLFIITCLFGFAYLYLYPGLGSYEGSLKWTQVGQLDKEMAKGNEQVAPIYAAFAGKSVPELSKDAPAMAIGDRLFMNNCAQCHGSDARGGKGFPDLTDKQWNWGGTPAQIDETITKGRTGMMPPMAAAVGSPEDVRNVANYVLSLSGACQPGPRQVRGVRGLPRCRRQGQPGPGRAQPDQRRVHARPGGGVAHRRHGHQRQDRRHARVGQKILARADQAADGLCVGQGRRRGATARQLR